MSGDERLLFELELWKSRAESALFSPRDTAEIPSLIETVKTWENGNVLEQLILDATNNARIGAEAAYALEIASSIGPEGARDILERLDNEHAHVRQLLHNVRVRRAIDLDREGQQERQRLATEIRDFRDRSSEQHRLAGGAQKSKVLAWKALAARIQSWEQIPTDPHTPFVVEDCDLSKKGERDVAFYRDGEQLICEDMSDRQIAIGTISESSFLKRYLKAGQKRR